MNFAAHQANEAGFAFLVPCRNEAQNITALLAALVSVRFRGVAAKRILVISDDSTDGTPGEVRAFAARSPAPVELVESSPRRGKPAMVNEGIRRLADCGVIVLVSGDVLPEPGCVEKLLAAFDDDGVGVAGGRPVPQGPPGFALRVSQILWSVHHRVASRYPKTTEITAFRHLGQRINEASLVDEAELEIETRNRGYRVMYAGEAAIRAAAPGRLRDYIRQRRRVALGYAWVRRRHRETFPTDRAGVKVWAAWDHLRREGCSVAFLAFLAIEAWIALSATLLFLAGGGRTGLWEPIASAKHPLVPRD